MCVCVSGVIGVRGASLIERSSGMYMPNFEQIW